MNKHERESGDGVFTQKSPVSFKHILDFHPDASVWWVLLISKGEEEAERLKRRG